jgi:hypothetical protein
MQLGTFTGHDPIRIRAVPLTAARSVLAAPTLIFGR